MFTDTSKSQMLEERRPSSLHDASPERREGPAGSVVLRERVQSHLSVPHDPPAPAEVTNALRS